jgi:hypothetical protein
MKVSLLIGLLKALPDLDLDKDVYVEMVLSDGTVVRGEPVCGRTDSYLHVFSGQVTDQVSKHVSKGSAILCEQIKNA